MSLLKKWETLTLLLLRCGLATVFIYHGYPKLFGSTGRFVESFQTLGLPAYFVYIAGTIEFFGGVAVWKYNLNEGIYAVREYELPLILGLASLAVSAGGGGQFTLDRLIRTQSANLK